MYIDTHCHLDLPPLSDSLQDVLDRARRAGVDRYLIPGIEPAGWNRIRTLVRNDRRILPAYGIHPQHAHLADDEALAELAACLTGGAVAVGEVGLDYQNATPPREIQQEAFRRQLRLAVRQGLPLLIHCRRAFADLLTILRQEGGERVGGLMHAFSGSPETARECIKLGFYISICGTVTYTHAVRPLRVVREIPLERLVLETDAPDLSPEPLRGTVNEPANLLWSARAVAALKGVTPEEVEEATTANVLRALKLAKEYLLETDHG
jgi:TatD DNase family protein